MTINHTKVSSLADFTAQVVESTAGRPRWFRGSHNRTYPLTPSLYRHPTINDVDELLAVESSLLSRFKQRSLPFISANLQWTDWDYFFLMQHYGVPTRLLDWSENAYVALWFALIDRPAHGADQDSIVWSLDPIGWNQKVYAFQSYSGGTFSPGDVQLDGYLQSTEAPMNKAPAALFGTHNSPRIVAQRGTFTIAGHDTLGLEEAVEIDGDELTAIIVPHDGCSELLRQLRAAGFAESMLFPDLDGLAREIKFTEGYVK